MSQSKLSAVLTAMLEPKLSVIFSILAVVLILPVLVHVALYRSSTKRSALPVFLLTGCTGAGKTSLQLLVSSTVIRSISYTDIQIERGEIVQTHTSQASLTIEAALPLSIEAKSDQYRSDADPNRKVAKRFLLVDTPGHGKLRHITQEYLTKPQQLKGIIFVVDAADLSTDGAGLRETAEYLHDLLLSLQKSLVSKSSRAPQVLPVLIAAHKVDLFTALPAPLVKKALEKELSSIRKSRSKSLFDSGMGTDDTVDPEKDWLGDTSEGSFDFSQIKEFNIQVSVEGGSTHGINRPDIVRYWTWLAESL